MDISYVIRIDIPDLGVREPFLNQHYLTGNALKRLQNASLRSVTTGLSRPFWIDCIALDQS